MHPVAAGTPVNLAQPVHTGCSAVWAMHWPICRSSPKSRRFTVEPGRAIDAGSCIRNLRSFACHGTDEIKTVGKNSSSVTIPVFPLLWHVAHRRTNCSYFFLPITHQERSAACQGGHAVNIYPSYCWKNDIMLDDNISKIEKGKLTYKTFLSKYLLFRRQYTINSKVFKNSV